MNVAVRPAPSGPSGYVSVLADERSSGAGSSGGFTRSVAVGSLLTTNCGRSGSATFVSCVAVENEPPISVPHFTVTEIVGIVLWPAFCTTISIVEFFASDWRRGKLTRTTFTGNDAFGSFVSCFSPPPQPLATSADAPAAASRTAARRPVRADPPKVRRSLQGHLDG